MPFSFTRLHRPKHDLHLVAVKMSKTDGTIPSLDYNCTAQI